MDGSREPSREPTGVGARGLSRHRVEVRETDRRLSRHTMGNGPKSWSKAKLRHKRPTTREGKRSQEQNVGRRPQHLLSRPEPPTEKQSAIHKPSRAKPLQPNEKRLRALNKLLRDIEALQQREAQGEALDEQQQNKVGRLDEVLSEMEALMGGSG